MQKVLAADRLKCMHSILDRADVENRGGLVIKCKSPIMRFLECIAVDIIRHRVRYWPPTSLISSSTAAKSDLLFYDPEPVEHDVSFTTD